MFRFRSRTLESTLRSDEVLSLIKGEVYDHAFDAFEEVGNAKDEVKAFVGSTSENGFKLSPIQRGRIVPMPSIWGQIEQKEAHSLVRLCGGPNLSALLYLMAFMSFGLVGTILAWPSKGFGALFVLPFPLLFSALILILLSREIDKAFALIESTLGGSKLNDFGEAGTLREDA